MPEADQLHDTSSLTQGQTRMAMQFVNDHKNKVRFVYGLGWHYWNKTQWTLLPKPPTNLAITTVMNMRKRAYDVTDKTEAKQLLKDCATCDQSNGLYGMLKIAGDLAPISIADVGVLDSDPYLFNFRNGTLDLRTGELLRHNRSDLITKVARCGYDPSAEGITFLNFIKEILPNEDVRDYVQRLIGYSMLGTIKEHVLPLFIGPGRNGKSKLLGTVREAFGDYGITGASSLLIQKAGNATSTDKVDLFGRRLVVCSESDQGNRFAAATVKHLTGGDAIRARKMYNDYIEFVPSHTIFMMTNHEPDTDGSDSAMFERIRKVSFTETFVGNRQDPGLSEKLELEFDVVMRWAVEGYQEYMEKGLTPPASVIKDTKNYQLNNDPIGKFLRECTVEYPYASTGSTDLWIAWNKWNEETVTTLPGGRSNTQKAFSLDIEARGFIKKSIKGNRKFLGIELSSTESNDHG